MQVLFCVLLSISRWTAAQYSAPQQCDIPNVIPGAPINQAQRLGTVYPYLYKGDTPPGVNPVVTYTALGQTFLPGTDIPALAVAESLYQYNSEDDLTCSGLFLQSYYTADGREIGLTFPSAPPSLPYSDVYYDLFEDDIFEFSYQCGAPSYVTGICSSPYFFLNTYQRPDQLSNATKAHISATVDRLLSPYCLSSADLRSSVFDSNLPFCTAQNVATPSCYTNLIQGLNATITAQNVLFEKELRLALTDSDVQI